MQLTRWCVGLDINDKAIFIAVVPRHVLNTHKKTSHNSEMQTFTISLVESIVNIAEPKYQQLLQQKLKEIDAHLSGRCEYYIGLEASQTLTQTLPLPKGISVRDYDTVISAALPRLFPLPEKELMFDYVVKESEFIITVTRRETIEVWQGIFKASKLKLANISVKREIQLDDLFHCAKQLITPSATAINFLPWRQRQAVARQRNCVLTGVIYMMLCLLSFIMLSLYYQENRIKSTEQLNKTAAQWQLKSDALKNIISMSQHIAALKREQQEIKQLNFNLFMLIKNFVFIANILPAGVWLNHLLYYSSTLILSGKGATYESVMMFINHLCRLPDIANCQLSSVNLQNNSWFSFEIKLQPKFYVRSANE